MRIVIQIDGENVVVQTDHPLTETLTAPIVDAGQVPAELLQQDGQVRESEATESHEQSYKTPSSRGKRGSAAPDREPSLNPLRAGEAAARKWLAAGGYSAQEAESFEATDGGKAPKLPTVPRKKKPPKRSARKR
jgi:hypothetical protein